jgi:hypothetical protein
MSKSSDASLLLVNPAFGELLRQNSLSDFDSFYSLPVGKIVKRVRKDRFTSRITLKLDGKDFESYIKRSRYSVLTDICKTIRKFTRQRSSFLNEYNALILLAGSGVPTITPIAAAAERKGIICRSFILTESLGRTVKLQDWAPQHLIAKNPQTEKAKRAIIESLARITRTMHESGINHRDYYLTHIHIKKDESHKPALFVIDLNRADIRKKVPLRWRVKDIAALNFSAPTSVFTRTDRIRFVKIYLSANKLGQSEKNFVKKVIKKSAEIARRAPRAIEKDREFITDAMEAPRLKAW